MQRCPQWAPLLESLNVFLLHTFYSFFLPHFYSIVQIEPSRALNSCFLLPARGQSQPTPYLLTLISLELNLDIKQYAALLKVSSYHS